MGACGGGWAKPPFVGEDVPGAFLRLHRLRLRTGPAAWGSADMGPADMPTCRRAVARHADTLPRAATPGHDAGARTRSPG
jgi:hypothetical protein